MKKCDLERELRNLGWTPCGGSRHDAWTNGEMKEFVPRHTEIAEFLARKILKKAKDNPPKRPTKT